MPHKKRLADAMHATAVALIAPIGEYLLMSEDWNNQLRMVVDKLAPEFRARGQRDVDALLVAGATSFNELLGLLLAGTASAELRATASWVLGRLGDNKAIPVLMSAATDLNSQVRAASIQALGELPLQPDGARIINLLSKSLLDTDEEVRKAATYALGLVGDSTAVGPLASVLTDPHELPNVRGMAAEALADIQDSSALPALLASLTDPSTEVRFWSAYAVGKLGDEQSIMHLERLLGDESCVSEHGSVKNEAMAAIDAIRRRSSS